jgi:hypothetical protein
VYPPTVARQRLGKNVTVSTNTQATEESLDAPFYMRSVSYQRKEGGWFFPEILVHIMRSPCCLSVRVSLYSPPPFCIRSVSFQEAYEITLLSVCLCIHLQLSRFLCSPCRMKVRQAIRCSQNFSFISIFSYHNVN